MKKIILLSFSLIWMFACQDDVVSNHDNNDQDTDTPAYTFSEDEVVKGHIRIKLTEEPTGEIGTRSADGKMRTGVRALDNSATALGIKHMQRTFPHAGQFEERTRREGLHLWYDVWFSEEVASTRAASDISILDGIQIASPVLKVKPTAASSRNAFSDSPFNDIELPKQWGFHNPGTERWQVKGADIRIFDVWEQYNGHPDIIVSIVDGGITLDHPDLQANLWINSGEIANNGIDDDGNGYVDDVYGYNFVSNSAKITPHQHGTHVAGTIGATNNNEIGVSGIAGGNGSPNSGVKLMNCQIFEHPQGPPVDFRGDNGATNIGAAIKYGADNGAIISQNSWGYPVGRDIDPAHKEAIDYFIKYAGCDNDGNQLPGSPMKGGIVLFASGNENSSIPRVAAPADYDKVLAVAAIGPDYKKSHVSNYGDYMDICAPGGIENGIRGIYSTTVAELGYYEYLYGTSMACPHVAGVAALIIQKYGVGKQGFTARQLEEILLTTAYDVDQYNPTYAGQLGTGCVNAYAALWDEVPDTPPFALVSNTITNGTLNFVVDMQMAGNATITIVNNTGMTVMRKEITTVRYVTFTLDISRLAAGYYTLDYECNGNKATERFIKY